MNVSVNSLEANEVEKLNKLNGSQFKYDPIGIKCVEPN